MINNHLNSDLCSNRWSTFVRSSDSVSRRLSWQILIRVVTACKDLLTRNKLGAKLTRLPSPSPHCLMNSNTSCLEGLKPFAPVSWLSMETAPPAASCRTCGKSETDVRNVIQLYQDEVKQKHVPFCFWQWNQDKFPAAADWSLWGWSALQSSSPEREAGPESACCWRRRHAPENSSSPQLCRAEEQIYTIGSKVYGWSGERLIQQTLIRATHTSTVILVNGEP